MKTAGIICEYNPFHNGHKLHIEKTRNALGVECIVCVMSPNVVQRGEIAVADMYFRAEKAIQNGADLVLSIPPRFALQSAQYYAHYGVYILNSLGNIDYLSFGSECGSVDELEKALLEIDEEKIKKNLKSGKTYGACISENDILRCSNNILGLEYIKALKNLNSTIMPYTVKREFTDHDSNKPNGNYASASYIRELIKENNDYSRFLPYEDKVPYSSYDEALGLLLSYKLSLDDENDFSDILNISEGLNNRILKQKNCTDLEKIVSEIYCKRYIAPRIRRAILSIIFDLKKSDALPTYTRVLALNDTGKKYLNSVKKTSSIKIYSKITKKDIYNNSLLAEELKINSIIENIINRKGKNPND